MSKRILVLAVLVLSAVACGSIQSGDEAEFDSSSQALLTDLSCSLDGGPSASICFNKATASAGSSYNTAQGVVFNDGTASNIKQVTAGFVVPTGGLLPSRVRINIRQLSTSLTGALTMQITEGAWWPCYNAQHQVITAQCYWGPNFGSVLGTATASTPSFGSEEFRDFTFSGITLNAGDTDFVVVSYSGATTGYSGLGLITNSSTVYSNQVYRRAQGPLVDVWVQVLNTGLAMAIW